jgi:hypothetical protein
MTFQDHGYLLYLCVYCTKSEPISNREAIDLCTRGARGGFVLLRTLDARGDANQCASDTSRTRMCKNQKISLHFSASPPPTPPPQGEKKWKGNFLVLLRHFVSKKFRSNLHLLESFSLHFSPPHGDPRRPAIHVWW